MPNNKIYVRRNILMIQNSGLFDIDYYNSQFEKPINNPVEHYVIYGWKENKNPVPHFDTQYYIENNPDVKNNAIRFNPFAHWIRFGKAEGRLPNGDNKSPIVNINTYRQPFNRSIISNSYNNKPRNVHHIRKTDKISISYNFNIIENLDLYNIYLSCITDESIDIPKKAQAHYDTYGNSEFNKIMNNMKQLNINPDDYLYMYKIDNFRNDYEYPNLQLCYKDIKNNQKVEFRYFCYRYLNYMRIKPIKKIKLNNDFETVLIEYRKFPHLEFLVRNMIDKLDENWSHTVLCGNLNYDYMVNICKNISPNIKVINTKFDNLNQTTYSKFLASKEFWNYLNGEKILIYQEDSIIFHGNINTFLQYDYIGAPWPKNQDDNRLLVGNGGFSLRSKSVMLQIIDKISIENTKYNSWTLKFMKGNKLTIGPEDVYFSKNMLDYDIGQVAPYEVAKKFSMETQYSENVLGGHNFWIACSRSNISSNSGSSNSGIWKSLLYEKIVKQYKPIISMNTYTHRGGWAKILTDMIKADIFNNNSKIQFIDLLEREFIWRRKATINSKWIGIVHLTPNIPKHLNRGIELNKIFPNRNFINSLKNCICIITLSDYLTNYMKGKLAQIGHNVKCITIKHPVIQDNIIKFDMNKYINNNNKQLVQLGQQLRRCLSIYLLDIQGFDKIWLPGNQLIKHNRKVVIAEAKDIGLNINLDRIKQVYYTNYGDYDELLSKNIIFCHLFDASANNTVLECIVRQTPIIINRLPAVEEYLGKDYPLYFDNLDEVKGLLTTENIRRGYEYLATIDQSELQIEYFINRILDVS